MLEQIADLLLEPLLRAGRRFGPLWWDGLAAAWGFWAASSLRTLATAQSTALVNLGRTWNSQTWCGTAAKTSAIGSGYSGEPSVVMPCERQARGASRAWEAAEEALDVVVGRVVVQHPVGRRLEGAVVHDGQHAERAVVQFIGGDVPGEVGQRPVEILGVDPAGRLFSPRPRPSSGSWRRGRRPGGPARGANWRCVGQAVLDHQAHGRGDDAVGVVAAGQARSGMSALKYLRSAVQ